MAAPEDDQMAAPPESPVVLVIDDEPSMRYFLRTLLELDGYTVYEAMNGPIGQGLIPVVLPAVVLLDVMMPGMDGVEVCTQVAADYPDLPVVILTARDDRALEDRCLAAGASCFLTKPLAPGQLADVFDSLGVAAPGGTLAAAAGGVLSEASAKRRR